MRISKTIIGLIGVAVIVNTASCADFDSYANKAEDYLSNAETSLENIQIGEDPSLEGTEIENDPLPDQSPTNTDVVIGQDGVATTTEFSGDNMRFYSSVGKAVVAYPDAEVDKITYLPVDTLKRPTGAYGYITSNMYVKGKEREEIKFDPVGFAGNNKQVEIVHDVNRDGVINAGKKGEDKAYRGWFYNRSHLVADSLGGSAIVENMITGTRMQNVGWNDGKGGMAYMETKAREFLQSPKSANCPLYYAATPNYVGSEVLPRTVTVNAKSCDGTIDEQVVVDNNAPGYTINYTTGSFKVQ